MKPLIEHGRLVHLVNYDSASGNFSWAFSRRGCSAGNSAGSKCSKGYWGVMLDRKLYLAHRLAWFYVHRVWPVCQIDHIDGNRQNNAISNLRQCTSGENKQNMKTYNKKSDNSSAYPGVSWSKSCGKWQAAIGFNSKRTHLGFFEDDYSAYEAYLKEKSVLHKFQPTPRDGVIIQ